MPKPRRGYTINEAASIVGVSGTRVRQRALRHLHPERTWLGQALPCWWADAPHAPNHRILMVDAATVDQWAAHRHARITEEAS